MGGGPRRRLTRTDLEAMLREFDIVDSYGETTSTVDEDLHQIRRNARLGGSLEEWARARGVPLTFVSGRARPEHCIPYSRDIIRRSAIRCLWSLGHKCVPGMP